MNAQRASETTEAQLDAPIESVDVPLWREPAAVLEWIRLRLSPVYSGHGVPRGDGAPVLLVPGFLCSDLPLRPLGRWLERIGYEPYFSGIRINAGCLNSIGSGVVERVEDIHAATGRRVHVVGHSLGGLLARCSAAMRPDLVGSVVALGSPFRQIRSHRLVVATARGIGAVARRLPGADPACLTPQCSCVIVQAAARYPMAVPFTAIYTRGDGVVDWEVCRTGNDVYDVEVRGSHVGLIYNTEAYRAIANHLAHSAAAVRAVA